MSVLPPVIVGVPDKTKVDIKVNPQGPGTIITGGLVINGQQQPWSAGNLRQGAKLQLATPNRYSVRIFTHFTDTNTTSVEVMATVKPPKGKAQKLPLCCPVSGANGEVSIVTFDFVTPAS